MRYILCYDIADDRRRARLVQVLKNYAERIQESVFSAEIDPNQAKELLDHAAPLLSPEDRLHLFPLCAACEKQVQTRGQAYLPHDEDTYIL